MLKLSTVWFFLLWSLVCLTGDALGQTRAKIVCFGDSITKRGYPETLGHLIGADVVNAGVAGNTTAKALRRMPTDVLGKDPDVVVVFFGTNDLRVDNEKVYVPVEKYQANLQAIVTACQKQGAKVVVCTLPPIRSKKFFERHESAAFGGGEGLAKSIAIYQTAAREIAAKNEVPLVDLQALLLKEPKWMSPDGVHPAEQGNAIIAKHVAAAVTPLLKEFRAIADVSGSKYQSDIVVYGATSAGIVAAVQAARMNKSVVLIESSEHVGGLTSGGLGATDIGNKGVIGGLSREFYHRVALHYQDDKNWVHETREEFFENRSKRTKLEEVMGADATMWTFEPHVADSIFAQLLNEAGVEVVTKQRIAEVVKTGSKISELVSTDGKRFRAKMFIDTSYEGDLLVKSGVSFRTGREANSLYQETLNGIRDVTPKNQFLGRVDPYVVPGDPKSGLVPLIQEGDGGVPGEGDKSIQAYNFRLCFTDIPENRMELKPPANYDPALYELAARQAETLAADGAELTLKHFCNPVWMPNRKTDINNSEGISTDFIGANYDYPNADYETRAKIWQAHADYVRGFWYFMSTSPRVPESLREKFLAFGPSRDEFTENGGWPTQLYVREARRMKSSYVMTEHNCRGKTVAEDSVGMAAYGMDSHNCQRVVKNGIVRNEGDVQKHGLKPYPISFRSIVPNESECENLVVPVCVSATHIAFGSIRMEPVFMVLGQSSAVTASLAIDSGTSVQALSYERLRPLLWASGQVLSRGKKK